MAKGLTNLGLIGPWLAGQGMLNGLIMLPNDMQSAINGRRCMSATRPLNFQWNHGQVCRA